MVGVCESYSFQLWASKQRRRACSCHDIKQKIFNTGANPTEESSEATQFTIYIASMPGQYTVSEQTLPSGQQQNAVIY